MRTVARLTLRLPVLTMVVVAACSSGRSDRGAGVQIALEVRTPTGARAWKLRDLTRLARRQVDEDLGGYAGVRLAELLGTLPASASVVVRGADGYTQTLSSATTTRADCLVVFEKDGHPLSAPEGPVRLIVPGSPGLSVRNLASIEVVPRL